MKLFILLAMIFCHITDDFYLQGILANLKQKQWWKDNYPDDLYKFDWIISLLLHSFSWSFMIHLPIGIYCIANNIDCWLGYFVSVLINTIIHAIIDHFKANKLSMSLTVDQIFHLLQIIMVWLEFYDTIYKL